jgi:hypothetical protein
MNLIMPAFKKGRLSIFHKRESMANLITGREKPVLLYQETALTCFLFNWFATGFAN